MERLNKEPDADQGGCRNRCIYSETRRKPEYQKCKSTESQGKRIIKLESDNQEPGNQNADKTDKG